MMATLIKAFVLGLALSLSLCKPIPENNSYQHAAVATDAAQCSEVGVELLRKGGNAVDAAVGSLLCIGVVNLQSTGLGGGGFLMYYNAERRETTCIDFREKAPAFIPESAMQRYIEDPTSTTIGKLIHNCQSERRVSIVTAASHSSHPIQSACNIHVVQNSK